MVSVLVLNKKRSTHFKIGFRVSPVLTTLKPERHNLHEAPSPRITNKPRLVVALVPNKAGENWGRNFMPIRRLLDQRGIVFGLLHCGILWELVLTEAVNLVLQRAI
jgi:hypothetical protein